MTRPWFRMDGSIFRIRPISWQGWAVVLGAVIADVLLVIAAVIARLTTGDLGWTLLPVVGFPVVLAVLFLIIAATVGRPERP